MADEPRIVLLEETAHNTLAALQRIERRLNQIDGRLDGVEQLIRDNLGQAPLIERRFDELGRDVREWRTGFHWVVVLMLLGFAGVLFAILAHGFHWL